jgi:hypothetical protein
VAAGGTLAAAVSGENPWQSSDIAALLQSGDFALGANIAFDVGSTTFAYAGTISDPAENSPLGVVVLGSGGTLDLTGDISGYSGGTTIVGATVLIDSGACLGNANSTITLDGGTLQAAGILELPNPVVLNQGGGTIAAAGYNVELDGQIAGPGGLAANGSGTVMLTAAN